MVVLTLIGLGLIFSKAPMLSFVPASLVAAVLLSVNGRFITSFLVSVGVLFATLALAKQISIAMGFQVEYYGDTRQASFIVIVGMLIYGVIIAAFVFFKFFRQKSDTSDSRSEDSLDGPR